MIKKTITISFILLAAILLVTPSTAWVNATPAINEDVLYNIIISFPDQFKSYENTKYVDWSNTANNRVLGQSIIDSGFPQTINVQLFYGNTSIGGSIYFDKPGILNQFTENITIGSGNATLENIILVIPKGSWYIVYAENLDTHQNGLMIYDDKVKAFYPVENQENFYVTRMIISGQNTFNARIWELTPDMTRDMINSEKNLRGTGAPPSLAKMAAVFDQISDQILAIALIIVTIQALFWINAPWIFLTVELILTVMAFMESGGNIFIGLNKWWKYQKKIVDFFMYFLELIEKHYVVFIVIAAIAVLSAIALNFSDFVAWIIPGP